MTPETTEEVAEVPAITIHPLEYSRPDIFGKAVARPHGIGWFVSCQTSDKDVFYWNNMTGRWDRGPINSWHIVKEEVALDLLQSQKTMFEKALSALGNFLGIMEGSRL